MQSAATFSLNIETIASCPHSHKSHLPPCLMDEDRTGQDMLVRTVTAHISCLVNIAHKSLVRLLKPFT